MAAALMTRLEPGQHATTVQFGMNMIRRVKTGEGDITAEGVVSYFGRRTFTAKAEIRAADGQLVAEASCTCVSL